MEDLERTVMRGQSKVSRWTNVGVVEQARESADTPEQATAKWGAIYKEFEARGEAQQDEVFAAVNAYFLVNGASPYGKYTKKITTAGGMSVDSGKIVKIVGRLPGEIRSFLRGRLEDSYMFLKYNPAVKQNEALATQAENAGVSREYSWLLADWLGRDCEYFVGHESDIYNSLRTTKIANAYDKRSTALATPDRAREMAPEAKIQSAPRQYPPSNNDLF